MEDNGIFSISKRLGNKCHLDTMVCDRSGRMTDCILQNPGIIGYIDTTYGHS